MNGNQLIVSNFRSWKGNHYVDLPSINLLLGSNSSGKSSIIHSLSLLKQSELSRRLIPNDSEIDLGRIEDQVNFHAKSQPERGFSDYIGFGFRYQIEPEDLMQIALINRRMNREMRFNPINTRLKEQANILGAELGKLEYIERFDDLGVIKEVTLSSTNQQLLRVFIKNISTKKFQVSIEVTDDPAFWCLFVELGVKNNRLDPIDEEKIKTKLNFLKEEHQNTESTLTAVRNDIMASKRSNSKAKNSLYFKLRNEEQKLSQKSRDLEHHIDQEAIALGSKLIPGENKKEKCSYLAKAISQTFEISFEALEEYNIVELLQSVFIFSMRPGLAFDKHEENRGQTAKKAMELLYANSNSIVVSPFHLLSLAKEQYQNFVSSVVRIGPHRERPDRISFANPNDKSTFVGTKGENVMSIINQSSRTQLKELNDWLALLEIPYNVNKKFNKQFNISQLILTDKAGITVSLADVGYGIGQVLPVILTSMLRENTIITIEQPELHLHPKLQANLADLFIRSAEKNNNTFILETHSEHIVLRLKRRQREDIHELRQPDDNKLRKKKRPMRQPQSGPRRYMRSDFFSSQFSSILPAWKSIRDSVVLSVIEIPNKDRKSQLTKITLTSDGEFDNIWPGDFFPERYTELGLEDDS